MDYYYWIINISNLFCIKIYDNGNIKIDILFTLGYTTSGAPKNIGIKEFPKPPNNPGITKKNIINNPCKVILIL